MEHLQSEEPFSSDPYFSHPQNSASHLLGLQGSQQTPASAHVMFHEVSSQKSILCTLTFTTTALAT